MTSPFSVSVKSGVLRLERVSDKTLLRTVPLITGIWWLPSNMMSPGSMIMGNLDLLLFLSPLTSAEDQMQSIAQKGLSMVPLIVNTPSWMVHLVVTSFVAVFTMVTESKLIPCFAVAFTTSDKFP